MVARAARLKDLSVTLAKIRSLHEARHASLIAGAEAARQEAEAIAARSYGEGSLALLFPELYAQRVDAAFRRRDDLLREAAAEASRLATAKLRAERLDEMYREAERSADRASGEREALEFLSLPSRAS